MLGGSIRHAAATANNTGNGTHIDENAVTTRQHSRQQCLNHQELAGEVDIEDMLPRGQIGFGNGFIAIQNACCVAYNVRRIISGKLLSCLWIAHIGLNCDGHASHWLQVDTNHLCAGRFKSRRLRSPDP